MCPRIVGVAREVAHRTVLSHRDVAVWAAAIGLQVMPGDDQLAVFQLSQRPARLTD